MMTFEKRFSVMTDPRDTRKITHLLSDIIGLTIIGVIAGCEGYEDIEEFGKTKHDWLKQYLKLPEGIPSHDTIERLFESINPIEFQCCFSLWVQETFSISDEQFLHIDGKSNRRSADKYRGKKMLHTVNVFAGENHLSIGQLKVDEKSNEITAIAPLLESLEITGKVITIDAMGCQKEIAKTIAEKNGYYVLAVKDNHKELSHEIQNVFKTTSVAHTYTTIEKDHGRIEERSCSVITDLRFVDEAINWAALYCIICVISKRTIGDKTTVETRYFISNMKQDAKFFLAAIRSHWGIENRLHWVLDILFHEDYCRKNKENAAENFNTIRKIALNIIRYYKGDKKSLRRRRLNAAWDDSYLQKLLAF
jgi:predicted transposase YbfD/YdcC